MKSHKEKRLILHSNNKMSVRLYRCFVDRQKKLCRPSRFENRWLPSTD